MSEGKSVVYATGVNEPGWDSLKVYLFFGGDYVVEDRADLPVEIQECG